MGEIVVFELPLEGWLSIGAVLIALLFILWIAALVRIGRLNKRIAAFVNHTGMPDLESVIRKLHEQSERLSERTEEYLRRVETLEERVERAKGNVGIIRYNPFGERGNDLSFSAAFVDDRRNGLVVSAIHSRDESRVYAKPLKEGASSYPLTPEELEAINQAKPKT